MSVRRDVKAEILEPFVLLTTIETTEIKVTIGMMAVTMKQAVMTDIRYD